MTRAIEYQVVVPRTRLVVSTVAALARAKEIAVWQWKRMAHPGFPPEVAVERVGQDGRRRRVWTITAWGEPQ